MELIDRTSQGYATIYANYTTYGGQQLFKPKVGTTANVTLK